MTQPRYDLTFKGDLIDGFFVDFVKADLQKLIKADQVYLDRLFSGAEQPIKKGVDKVTAIKFQQAFKKVGAKLIVRAHGTAIPAAETRAATPKPTTLSSPAPAPAPAPAQPVSASAAKSTSIGEFTTTLDSVAGESDPALAEHHQPSLKAPSQVPNWSVSEPGTQLVESIAVTTVEIDLSGLSIADVGEDLILDKPLEPAPPILDIDNISLAEPGATLDTLKDEKPPVQVDTSHLSVE
ncbi:hypothetical protein [Reinekea sp.]|jgi:hypothetical protein|uniref:hypothetical protein n=1 Tax=Reinekea sp. TaxID=1970455 RepID=UPI003989CD07